MVFRDFLPSERLFLLSPALMLLHVLEEWLTDPGVILNQLDRIYLNLSPLFSNGDQVIIFIAGLMMVVWLLTCSFVMLGGRWRMGTLIFFGLIFVTEVEEIIRGLLELRYHPGLVTATLLTALGVGIVWHAFTEEREVGGLQGLVNRVFAYFERG